jgi:hypothetical protein
MGISIGVVDPAVRGRLGAHRVLVMSADMGGGHNATAAAVEEAAESVWPGSDIRRLDTLDVMGPGIGRLFRRIYVGNVEVTPWLRGHRADASAQQLRPNTARHRVPVDRDRHRDHRRGGS